MSFLTLLPIVLADVAALSLVDDARIVDRTVVAVATLQDVFVLDKSSTLGADGITIVATLSGTGRWLRYELASRQWRDTATWHINSATGSDENRGDSAGAALATHAELMRRLGRLIDTIHIVNIDSNLTEDILINHTHDRSGAFAVGGIIYRGSRTTARSGTITAATPYDPSTDQDGQIEDTGIVNWSADVDRMIVLTSGANAGAFAWIASDLTSGGNATARHSPFMTGAFGSVIDPAVGDDYDIVTLTQITGNVTVGPSPALAQFEDLSLSAGKNVQVFSLFALFIGCDIDGDDMSFEGGQLHTVALSRVRAAAALDCIAGARLSLRGALIETTPRARLGGKISVQDPSIGQSPVADGGPDRNVGIVVREGGQLEIQTGADYGVFDMANASFAALRVEPSGFAELAGTLWGTGNSIDEGVIIETAGRAIYDVVPRAQTPAVAEAKVGSKEVDYAFLPATDTMLFAALVERNTGPIAAFQRATGSTSSPTKNGTTFAIIPEMTVTVTSNGGLMRVHFGCTFTLLDNDEVDIALFKDGVQLSSTLTTMDFHASSGVAGLSPGSIDGLVGTLEFVDDTLVAGQSVTYDASWAEIAGTARARETQRHIVAYEFFKP